MTEVPHAGDSQQSSSDERLDRIIAAYLEAEIAGRPPDRALLMRENPDLAGELNAFFADHDRIHKLADPLRAAHRPAAEPDAPQDSGSDPNAATLVSNAAAGTSLSPLPAGTRLRYFGAYEILREIARGGMGVVYEARQSKLNRVVALKMILAGHLASPEDVRRFHAEAEAAASLDHPGIVPIFEVGEHEGQHFFSMGFVDGASLASRIAEGPLPPREAAKLVRTVAGAVQYAHTKGIIHLDLKPANVLLEKSGQPRVTDFGLARCVKADSRLTVSGQILGTPSYMPPEQARGDSADVTPLSDVYSLGAVLYCLVTGRPPFQAANPMDTLFQVMSREPVSPRQLNTAVPLDLETIILKCLEKQPSRRYASAQQLVEELTRFLEGRPILARPVSAAERGWRWCRRNPAVAGLAAAVVMSLVAGTAISTSFAFEARAQARDALAEKNRANDKAREAKANAERADQKTAEAIATAQRERMQKNRADANAKESRRHLYAAHMNLAQNAWEDARVGKVLGLLKEERPKPGEEDLRGFEWHYWNRLAHSYQLKLDGHANGARSVAFSPDGRRLASAGWDETVKVWDATSGELLHTLKGHTHWVWSVAFSPDGRRLASAGGEFDKAGELICIVWDTTSGEVLLTLSGHTSQVVSVAFSADGNRLASAAYDQSAKVWDATSGELLSTLEVTGKVWSMAFSPDGKRLATVGGPYGDYTVKVWDGTSGELLQTLKGHTGGVLGVTFSADGKRLASAGGTNHKSGEVKVWDAASGELLLTLKGHTGIVTSVAFSPDGKRLASGSEDRTVKVWDATSGQEPETLQDKIERMKRLSQGIVLDVTSGEELLTLKGHINPVTSVAFSPDGSRLASGSGDQAVKVWDTTSGQESLTFKGHSFRNPVMSVAFSAEPGAPARLASAGYEVKVWDATKGEVSLTFKGHTEVLRLFRTV